MDIAFDANTVALAAILVPTITCVITCIFESRKHKKEMALAKFKLVFPEKRSAYLELSAEISRLIDSNGHGYDRLKLVSIINKAMLLSDEKTQDALIALRNVCFSGDSPWNYAQYAIREMNRELTSLQSGKPR